MAEGWILLHRKIQECDIWDNDEPYDWRSAWVDLLLLANHKDVETIFDYKPLTIKRGQYLTSVRKLSRRWGWGKDKTLKYLRLLESLKMISKDSDSRRTLLTIEKYDDYQCDPDTGQTQTRTVSRQSADTLPPQTKNEKNEKNKYICSFDAFWEVYPRKNDKSRAYKCYMSRLKDGYTEDQLLTACKNYAEECKKNGTEQKYIKHGATFLSVNEPFLDYLKGETNGSGNSGAIRTDEEQRNAEIDRYLESDEYKQLVGTEADMPFM